MQDMKDLQCPNDEVLRVKASPSLLTYFAGFLSTRSATGPTLSAVNSRQLQFLSFRHRASTACRARHRHPRLLGGLRLSASQIRRLGGALRKRGTRTFRPTYTQQTCCAVFVLFPIIASGCDATSTEWYGESQMSYRGPSSRTRTPPLSG